MTFVNELLVSTFSTSSDPIRLGRASTSAVKPEGRFTSIIAMLLSALSLRLRLTNLQKILNQCEKLVYREHRGPVFCIFLLNLYRLS